MFTGDRSGEFLYRALWQAGYANRPQSVSRDDGLRLTDAYITAPVRCVPPDNKPALDEIIRCRPYLTRELAILRKVRVVVALGGIGLNAYLSVLQQAGDITSRTAFPFGHGMRYAPSPQGPAILASYHPSQQNTSTGRLTEQMLREIFFQARKMIEEPA
jgi:uracil-DNA glycosylase family 4